MGVVGDIQPSKDIMTVQELMNKLSRFPGNCDVAVLKQSEVSIIPGEIYNTYDVSRVEYNESDESEVIIVIDDE